MLKIQFNIKEILYYLFVKLPGIIRGKISGNLIYVHWGKGLGNFGDCLSPEILRYYGFTPVYAQYINSDIILAGTVLQEIPKQFKGIILGAGADNVKLEFPFAKILGVRGLLTKKNLSGLDKVVLGDPGLLMNLVYPKTIGKEFEIGIVPHFVDKDHDIIKMWQKRFGSSCIVIDVLKSPKVVIDKIKRCKAILSSSLHGLIIADAFNIPNSRFVIRDTMPSYFYDYKFDDYYSALNILPFTIEVNGTESLDYLLFKMRNTAEQVKILQKDLDYTFKQLKNYLIQNSNRTK